MRLGAITDEFSPDLDIAAPAMRAAGLETAELRVLWGQNILDVSDAGLDRALGLLERHSLQVDAIASPLLKCTLPGGPPLDERFTQDVFASRHTFADQERLALRAFAVAQRFGARIIRVFSYWRTLQPMAIFEELVHTLVNLAERASEHNLIIGLENEHACNISTARDTARILAAVDHPNLQVVWDPANAFVAGENPFPDGFHMLPVGRIAHVHAKDCRRSAGQIEWVALGDGEIDWSAQILSLARERYTGDINLETHWGGLLGDKIDASRLCAHRLRMMAAAA